jgi:hypothetical protein
MAIINPNFAVSESPTQTGFIDEKTRGQKSRTWACTFNDNKQFHENTACLNQFWTK